MATLVKATKTLVLTERSAHTAYFDTNLDKAGYIIVNLPIEDWHRMGEPTSINIVLEPSDS